MKLTDAFERVVVLNLPFKEDRRARLEAHLAERGLADPDKLIWQRAWCGDWTGHPAWWSAGNGAWGCLMSHVRACEDALASGAGNYLVLEDDVVFHHRAAEWLEGIMESLPEDWGQLYLGGQYLHQEPQVVDGTYGKIMRPFNVNRTHAFSLNKCAMAPFLRHVLHAPDYMGYSTTEQGMPCLTGNHYHIDHQLGRAHERRDWQVYTPRWWLAGQAAGASNVSGKINPEMWWTWRSWGHKLPVVMVPSGLPEEERNCLLEHCHFGNTLIPSTLRDKGLTAAIQCGMREWLEMLAGEAVERWLLPAVEIRQDSEMAAIKAAWPPGIRDYLAEPVLGIRDYPANGLLS